MNHIEIIGDLCNIPSLTIPLELLLYVWNGAASLVLIKEIHQDIIERLGSVMSNSNQPMISPMHADYLGHECAS
jgi:hypothetical protein